MLIVTKVIVVAQTLTQLLLALTSLAAGGGGACKSLAVPLAAEGLRRRGVRMWPAVLSNDDVYNVQATRKQKQTNIPRSKQLLYTQTLPLLSCVVLNWTSFCLKRKTLWLDARLNARDTVAYVWARKSSLRYVRQVFTLHVTYGKTVNYCQTFREPATSTTKFYQKCDFPYLASQFPDKAITSAIIEFSYDTQSPFQH